MGKILLIVVCDGVEQGEVDMLRKGFEREHARVLVASPQEFLTVETVAAGRRGQDITVDLTFEAAETMRFDAVIIPDGPLSTEALRKDLRVVAFLQQCHERGMSIFASGNAVRLLYDSGVLSQRIVVREGTPLNVFFDRAVDVLLDYPLRSGYVFDPEKEMH
jgi:putative intracellular protease/amidase